MNKQPLMRRVQQLHLWLGTLFAPMIIFFSLTGALQTFNLHEKPGTPTWVARLASVHKNQNLAVRERRQGPPSGATPRASGGGEAGAGATAQGGPSRGQGPEDGGREGGPSPLPLKIFVVGMSLGLIVTTLLGVWMAFKYSKNKAVVWGLLIAGTLLPIALLFV